MVIAATENFSPDQRLDEILAAYLEEAEAGREPDRRAWLARHPEFADEMRAFFANLDHVGRLAAPFRTSDGADVIPFASPDVPAVETGRITYFGDYELLRVIGRGGMGVVYAARQVSLDRVLALKMIAGHRLNPGDDLRRFRREAEAAAHLDHPNIVPIHEIGEHDGCPYFSMRLVDGGSLAGSANRIRGDFAATARLVATVARAVDYAHRRGILHRDLKPSNILLDRQGRPHVADFGLARRFGPDAASTVADAILGTPSYMAPEQAEGRREAVTTAADIYGLGAILYEMLTDRPPFLGETAFDVLRRVRDEEPQKPRSIDPKIPRDLETACLKCLEKDPFRRYASAEALADDLDRYLAGQPIAARRASTAERVLKWTHRRPTAAALLVACVVAVATAAVAVRGLLSAERWRAEVTLRDRARDEADVRGYADRIAAAERAVSGNDLAIAERLLDDAPARLRGWEWHFWKRLCHEEIRTLRGHNGTACGVAFAPKASIFSCQDERGGLVIWDASTDREVYHLPGHDGSAYGVAFNVQGTRLAAAGGDGHVRVWDLTTGHLLRSLPGHGEWAAAVAFSPDGDRIASGGADRTVRVWDAATGEERMTLRGHSGAVLGVAFGPDGSRLASAGADGAVILWEARTGKEVRRLPGHAEAARCVAFSPDGKRLASGGADRSVRVWDVADGHEILAFRAADARVDGLAISPDGSKIATGGLDRSVKVWDAATGRELASYRGHEAPVFSVAFAPDGHLLASSGQDAVVKLWDATNPPEARVLRAGQRVRWTGGVAFGPGGRVLAGGSHGPLVFWDAATGQTIRTVAATSGIAALAVAPTGSFLASVDLGGSVRLLDASSGEVRRTLPTDHGPVASVALSPDGQWLATGGGSALEVVQVLRGKGVPPDSERHAIRIWDPATGQQRLSLPGHEGPVYGLAASPDGRLLASAGADGTVRLWDATSGRGQSVLKGHAGPVLALAFAPDGRLLASAGADGTVRLWDAATGDPLISWPAHAGWAMGVAFHPDGSRLASAGADGVVKLWETTTGREMIALRGHADRVRGLAFSPDGHRLASASEDGTVRIWDASPRSGVVPHP